METAKCPNCRRFPQSLFCGFWHALFLQRCSGGFKTCTNITATVPLEIMNEATNCLNCIPVAKHLKKSSFVFFLLFSLAKKTDRTKGQICKAFSTKVKNVFKSSFSDKVKQVPHYLGTWATFGAMLLLRFVLH
jgi:hypothetical protein